MTTRLPVAVSVILPAYLSQETVAGCLRALRAQTFRGFEVLVADSSPDERTAEIVRNEFPEVQLVRSATRLLPHGGRNLGASQAQGTLFVFSDPDVYPRADWLEHLVSAHARTGGVVVGALADAGSSWRERGMHLCKFSKWLPGQPASEVDNAPTANVLIPRTLFEQLGGFAGENFLGDALLSWRLREHGHRLYFAPDAIVAHHHLSTLTEFFQERYRRGVLFGDLRTDWEGMGRAKLLLYLGVSLLPLRLVRILMLVGLQCTRAGALASFAATLPLIALGHQASLLGECRAYVRRLRPPRQAVPAP